jgi:mono/diheme cytochrome c family protein
MRRVLFLSIITTLVFACVNNKQEVIPTTTPAPTITSFSPTNGVVGTTVTIVGTNFSTTATGNTVKFNGIAATVSTATTTSLAVSVPTGATTGNITVTVGGQTATSSASYTVTPAVIPAPTITSFSPANGAVGTTVTITGTNFSTIVADNTVKFNGTTATVSAASATSLTVAVPTGATTGSITVAVGGKTATSASNYTVTAVVLPAPTITSFSPTTGVVGTTVTITGTNFSTTATNNTVKFNGIPATVSAATTTSLTVDVPTAATTGKVAVTVNSQTATSSANYTVIASMVAFSHATIKPLFDTYCASCHTTAGNNWIYNPADYASIKNSIAKLYSEVYKNKTMPQGTKLSASELAAFKDWYDAGYPAK